MATGCENSIEPFDEEGTYSIYGVLDVSGKTQLFRVKPLSVPITKVDSETVSATATLENVTEGTSEVLRDSVIVFEDGGTKIITHNFVTTTPIAPETRYRLTVEGDAGTARATTVTPTNTEAVLSPQHGECGDTYTAVFPDISDPRRIRAAWEVKWTDMPALFRRGDWASFSLSGQTFRRNTGEVVALFEPADTLSTLIKEVETISGPPSIPDSIVFEACYSMNTCAVLDSDEVRLRYTYLGPEWYGEIPADSLTYDPLESHDVSNGLGFFGSVVRNHVSTTVNTADLLCSPGGRCPREPPCPNL